MTNPTPQNNQTPPQTPPQTTPIFGEDIEVVMRSGNMSQVTGNTSQDRGNTESEIPCPKNVKDPYFCDLFKSIICCALNR
jgi:hypothetical protein